MFTESLSLRRSVAPFHARASLTAFLVLFTPSFVHCAVAADTLYSVTVSDKKFLSEIVVALQKKDSAWIADHMVYPLSVAVSNRTQIVKSKEEFAPVLRRELTDYLSSEIVDAATTQLFKNWQGVMIGGGLLWFSQYSRDERGPMTYGILAIGSFAFQPRQTPSAGESHVDTALLTAARKAAPIEITTNQLAAALSSGLWNSNLTALAISIPQPKASVIFVFLRQTNGTYLASNASGVEAGNFGKLGRERTDYERFETTPVEWLHRTDGKFQVIMRTRAWRNGQRYTVSEPLLIGSDGVVMYR